MAIDKTQKYGVIGLGRSGLATVSYLCAHGVTPYVFDTRQCPPLKEQLSDGVSLECGPLDASKLAMLDVLIVGPGLCIRKEPFISLRTQGISVIGDVELFSHEVDAPVVAITGSNGKTTVTSLLGEMARRDRIHVAVGGNIGTPVLELPDHQVQLYVLELSSFQLETTSSLKLRAGTVLNVSADHMNRYRDLEDYRNAKLRIFEHCDHCIVNADDPLTRPLSASGKELWHFSLSQNTEYWVGGDEPTLMCGDTPLIACHDLGMSGQHNWANALAALALGDAAGISREAMVATLKGFKGLAHRCELIKVHKGIHWINDSKATNIGATIAALKGFAHESGETWLIAGGDGKGADFSELAPWLDKMAGVVVFGMDGKNIKSVHHQAIQVADLNEAVLCLSEQAKPGDRVLLSPACASLDMYSGFEQRGDHFRQLVEAL
ncbi:MAG: UDP-N-acetylmuramoylalanine--D-glutamate ligase [Candidatus Celerinatantimonas neptuna]|nr:MAG: UDP-N-acetylmuramoylalanine--D-glutamate ligase [Candidatus Celerinatantimonas neptuna]